MLGCRDCGRRFTIKELVDELDDETLERLAMIRCDRT
jgi:hypothetical protein